MDIEQWVKASAERSGVPLKVSDKSTLLFVASQINQGKTNQLEKKAS